MKTITHTFKAKVVLKCMALLMLFGSCSKQFRFNLSQRKYGHLKKVGKRKSNLVFTKNEDGQRKIFTNNDTLVFQRNELKIRLWDKGAVDGDVVSVFVNDSCRIKRHRLTRWKKRFKLEFRHRTTNTLTLFAHNLGIYPPNTGALLISDGQREEELLLKADLQTEGTITIMIK